MILTWKWESRRPEFSVAQNARIQDGVKEFIENYIREQLGSETPIKFQSLWSTPISKDLFKVHFDYAFLTGEESEKTSVSIKGECLLKRGEGQTDENEEEWELESIQISDESIEYLKGLSISSEQETEN
ncbi:MAG: hypothetical protein KDD25_03175 [Bdellovibrionales bacterium]|nr:hypothetical protein [Bdellovibrionales bacterium]